MYCGSWGMSPCGFVESVYVGVGGWLVDFECRLMENEFVNLMVRGSEGLWIVV